MRHIEGLGIAPVIEGRHSFTGVVIHTECYDNRWGSSYKMCLKVDAPTGPFLLWGTIPGNVLAEAPADGVGRIKNLLGATIQVTSRLRSSDKPHMAYVVRPKGLLLALTPEVQAVKDRMLLNPTEIPNGSDSDQVLGAY